MSKYFLWLNVSKNFMHLLSEKSLTMWSLALSLNTSFGQLLLCFIKNLDNIFIGPLLILDRQLLDFEDFLFVVQNINRQFPGFQFIWGLETNISHWLNENKFMRTETKWFYVGWRWRCTNILKIELSSTVQYWFKDEVVSCGFSVYFFRFLYNRKYSSLKITNEIELNGTYSRKVCQSIQDKSWGILHK